MTQPQQLGFGFDAMLKEQETVHLPGTMDEAIPFYRKLIERHHTAMLAGDVPAAMKLCEEAHELAVKVNGGDAGIWQGGLILRHMCWSARRPRPWERCPCGVR
jgi:hypothetical protein